MKALTLNVGDLIKVMWSNGAGYSVYRVEDSAFEGQHILVLVEETETAVAKD